MAGRANEALVVGHVDKGQSCWADGHFGSVGSVSQGGLVLLIGGIAEYPEGIVDQVISEDIDGPIAAVGVESGGHDGGIVFESCDLFGYCKYNWTVAEWAIVIDIRIACGIGVQLSFQQANFGSDIGYLRLKQYFLLSGKI